MAVRARNDLQRRAEADAITDTNDFCASAAQRHGNRQDLPANTGPGANIDRDHSLGGARESEKQNHQRSRHHFQDYGSHPSGPLLLVNLYSVHVTSNTDARLVTMHSHGTAAAMVAVIGTETGSFFPSNWFPRNAVVPGMLNRKTECMNQRAAAPQSTVARTLTAWATAGHR